MRAPTTRGPDSRTPTAASKLDLPLGLPLEWPLNQYDLIERLRSSETASVYRARHQTTGKLVAIKLLDAPISHPHATTRFGREAESLQECRHPHIVPFIEASATSSGRRFIITEFLTGTTLEEVVRKWGPLPDGRTLGLLRQACQALMFMHDQGWVHRDIKPANLVLGASKTQGERLTVIDFGLACKWQETANPPPPHAAIELGVAGTPAYLSPEAAQSPHAIDPRSDIYSLGCVGYFLLSGHPPFTGHNPIEICWKQIYQPPLELRTQLPHQTSACVALTSVIMRCLAKNPLDRPQSASDLLRDLEEIQPLANWSPSNAAKWWDTECWDTEC